MMILVNSHIYWTKRTSKYAYFQRIRVFTDQISNYAYLLLLHIYCNIYTCKCAANIVEKYDRGMVDG